MVPVDHVARVIVASSFEPPVSPLGVAQVTSHPRLTFDGFLGALESYGYETPQVDYPAWRTKMEKYVAESQERGLEDHAL